MRLMWVFWKSCCQPSRDPTWCRHALIWKSKYGVIRILGNYTINVITYSSTLIVREPDMKKGSFEWNNQSNDFIYFVDKCKLFVKTNVIRWSFVCSVLKIYYIEPSQDQYGAWNTTRCPREYIKCMIIGCMWMFTICQLWSYIYAQDNLPPSNCKAWVWNPNSATDPSPPLVVTSMEWEGLANPLITRKFY